MAMTTTTTIPRDYRRVCAVQDVPPRGKKTVRIDNTRVLIVACDQQLYAIEDRCPQTGRSIAHGEVLDCAITSPSTGARYCLRSGRYLEGGLSPLQSHWLTIFPLRVIGDQIYVYVPG
jgi:nitrite reductase/ring-hydroxylating ferredoxin subunit